jgi:hypothetical protein
VLVTPEFLGRNGKELGVIAVQEALDRRKVERLEFVRDVPRAGLLRKAQPILVARDLHDRLLYVAAKRTTARPDARVARASALVAHRFRTA